MREITRDKKYYDEIIKGVITKGVITIGDFKEVIAKVEGKSNCGDFTLYNIVLPELEKILGENLETVSEDGDRKNKLYSISGTWREVIKAKSKEYWRRKKAVVKVVEKKEVTTTTTTRSPRKHPMNHRGYRTMIWVLRLLALNKGVISCKAMRSGLTEHKAGQTGWMDKVNKYLGNHEKGSIENYSRTSYKFIGNLGDALSYATKEYNSIYSEKLEVDKYLKCLEIPEETKRPERKVPGEGVLTEETAQEKFKKYCILSVIGAQTTLGVERMTTLDSVSKTLRIRRAIGLSVSEIKEICRQLEKKFPETIEFGRSGEAIKLGKSYETALGYYKPEPERIMLRTSLTAAEVKKYFEEKTIQVVTESKISDSDWILTIEGYIPSYQGEQELLRLWRGFRGTEKILGNPGLSKKLQDLLDLEIRRLTLDPSTACLIEFEKED
jgi:hypothetical protein